MDFLYSLYDALVGVQIPPDKARAVVGAMERDMATTLATKSDLDMRQALLKSELEMFRREVSQEFSTVRRELGADIAAVRKDLGADITAVRKDLTNEIATLRREMAAEFVAVRKDLASEMAAVRKDMELMRRSLVIQLGSMLVVCTGLLLAALRLTGPM